MRANALQSYEFIASSGHKNGTLSFFGMKNVKKGSNLAEKVYFCNPKAITPTKMNSLLNDDEFRRDELLRTISHSIERLTLHELEALYYDMVTKDDIR